MLTIPYSSECLDEAKRLVFSDPASNRSWNLCWLILMAIRTQYTLLHLLYEMMVSLTVLNSGLVHVYASLQASRSEMWGYCEVPPESIGQLTQAFVSEWTSAVDEMSRHWELAPCR